MDYNLIDIISWGGIDFEDYPDFSDAFIEEAEYDGIPMNDYDIESLDPDWVYEQLFNHLY